MIEAKSKAVSRVEEEHQQLKQEMAVLKLFAMREVLNEDFDDWRLEFVWQLRDFKNRLLKHFDLEEEGGFMHEVLAVSPQSQHDVEQLKDEHLAFSKEMDRVIESVRSMRVRNPELLQLVRVNLNEIILNLRNHENDEHRLIQRAFYREYGGPA